MAGMQASRRAAIMRAFSLVIASVSAIAAGWAFLHIIGGDEPNWLDFLRAGLLFIATFWLVFGGLVGVIGAFASKTMITCVPTLPTGKTVVLIPIYNEDPVETFARIAAMNREIVALGVASRFDFAILSDTTNLEVAAQEIDAFELLTREPEAEARIFYRRRERNTGRKAGNIEDFVRNSGAAYDYAVILDADSLMEGKTLIALAERMDNDPRLGLLQTVPTVINADSLFGRMMAFSAAYLSPFFARGAALAQGDEGPYWGHNAIVRVRAFAQCCGLPVLSGRPPWGGHILSHDYVEAALLSRGGWKVRMDPAIPGSYEHGPENLIEYAKRDRRWCQGNLQHHKVLAAPKLKFWNRFTLLQGIMAYLASPIWLALMITSLLATAYPDSPGERLQFAPWILGVGVAAVLLLPKLAIALRGAFDGTNAQFGGTARVLLSTLGEIVISTIMAPILLAFQTRAVIQIFLGLDGGWPATERDAQVVPMKTAIGASWWIMLVGVITIGFTMVEAPAFVLWLLPVTVPAVLAPLIIRLTSHSASSPLMKNIFSIVTERQVVPVIAENKRILQQWSKPQPVSVAPAVVELTAENA
ncbi:glucans biosynthesis glucosyltransferase MdoH [Devosia sp. MC1541]|uniref:glucans biosynthesis glucosyltransferase MdoH n=1 Tax=Devosia sp. MC1541 TaxID=2725264 RepID=UPI0020BECBE7|nr:glucans biosynthesis glucosyltransferase MdoH [Devosia sp. MC1541]